MVVGGGGGGEAWHFAEITKASIKIILTKLNKIYFTKKSKHEKDEEKNALESCDSPLS